VSALVAVLLGFLGARTFARLQRAKK